MKKVVFFLYHDDDLAQELIDYLRYKFTVADVNDILYDFIGAEKLYIRNNDKFVAYKTRDELLLGLCRILPYQVLIVQNIGMRYARNYRETPRLIICKNLKRYCNFGSLYITSSNDFRIIGDYAEANLRPEKYFASIAYTFAKYLGIKN